MTDEPHYYGLVCSDVISDSGVVFADHIAMFDDTPHQYHAIAKFQILNSEDVKIIQQKQNEQNRLPVNKRQPIILSNKEEFVLQDFLETSMEQQQDVRFYVGYRDAFLTTKAKVLDIPLCRHLDLTLQNYPKHMSYFMYGEGDKAYLSHNISKNPDFVQVINSTDVKSHILLQELMYCNYYICFEM